MSDQGNQEALTAEQTQGPRTASSVPQLTNVHVDCVSYDRTAAAAGFTLGDGRYHIWFNPQSGVSGDTLYKNPVAEIPSARAIKLNPKAKVNQPLLAEMWRQIADGNMIAEAIRMRAYEDVWDLAESDALNFDIQAAIRKRAADCLRGIAFSDATDWTVAIDRIAMALTTMRNEERVRLLGC